MIKTKSEILFERFCQENGMACEKIAVSLSKTADYEIKVKSKTMICEVKELTPNAEDKRLRKELDEKGSTGIHERKISGRLSKKIMKAAEKLKQYKNRNVPLIVAFYDNILFNGGRVQKTIDRRDIDQAMYGIDTGYYLMSARGIRFNGFRHGQNKRMTTTEKNYVSAVFVLKESDDGIKLEIYHNYFALFKIDMSVFNFPNIRQFYHKNEPGKCSVNDLVCV